MTVINTLEKFTTMGPWESLGFNALAESTYFSTDIVTVDKTLKSVYIFKKWVKWEKKWSN